MKQVFFLALAVSLGAALGAGFATVLVCGGGPLRGDRGNPESLAKAIADLSAAVRTLEEKVGSLRIPAAPEPASPAAGGAPPSPSEELGRTMRDLTGRLDLLQSAMAERFAGQPPLALQTARSPDLTALEDLRSKSVEERGREHAMWTFRQVLDRYGRPDEVGGYSYGDYLGIRWTYALAGDRLLKFSFIHGYAIWVNDERQAR